MSIDQHHVDSVKVLNALNTSVEEHNFYGSTHYLNGVNFSQNQSVPPTAEVLSNTRHITVAPSLSELSRMCCLSNPLLMF